MYIPGWGQFVQLIEWVLVQLATVTGNSGLAIILLTIIIKLAMVPLTLSSLRSAKRMQEIQPLIKDLQKRYGDDRQMLSAETMKLYQEHKVNPFGSCLPLVLQMPIFIGLYYAILSISTKPEEHADLGVSFLWMPNIAQHDPLYILPFVVVITQFIQQRMAMPQRTPGQVLDQQQQIMNQTMMFMPLMIGYFAWNFASGPVLYWITQNIFSAVQQYFITGFGALRDLPGLAFLPVPPWVTPPPSAATETSSKVIVTKSKPGGTASRPDSAASQPSGSALSRMYALISKRVEEVERQRGEPAAPSADQPQRQPGARPTGGDEGDGPVRRSSRRARPRR